MGKSLIIVGGNFQQNGIADLANWTEITANLKVSAGNRQYLHYPNNNFNDAFQYSTSLTSTRKLYTIDIHAYVGRRIRVTWQEERKATSFSGGCWWRCFASALASGVSLPWAGTTTKQNAVTAVERITGNAPSSATQPTLGEETIIMTIPSGAYYLVFGNDTNLCPTPKVWIENT